MAVTTSPGQEYETREVFALLCQLFRHQLSLRQDMMCSQTITSVLVEDSKASVIKPLSGCFGFSFL